MKNRTTTQHKWIGWVCAGLLLALSLLFLEHALFPPPGQIMGGQDASWQFAPWVSFAREALREGRLPLWDPHHFGGYPFLSNPQVGFFYPPTWLAMLLPVNVGVSFYVALHVWLAGVGMMLFVRQMRGNWLGALLAAIAFSFSGFVSARIWGGHFAFLAVHVWTPWILLALAWSVQRGDAWSAIIAGLPIAMAILAGHTTSLVYVGVIWLAFAVYLFVAGNGLFGESPSDRMEDKGLKCSAKRNLDESRRDSLKPPIWKRLLVVRQVAIGALMGLTLSMVQLLPLIELASLSTRVAGAMEEFGYLGAMPPAHLITLVIPDYFGEPIWAGYWSVPNFTELTYYVGTLPILGMALALRKPTRLTWLYVALVAFGLMLALGGYGFLYRIVYDLLPPFRMMRAPGRAGFLYTFAASALLGEAISTWANTLTPVGEGASNTRQHYSGEILSTLMRWALIIIGITGVAGLAATGATFISQHPSDTAGRLWHQVGGWSVALVSMLIGGMLLWRYLTSQTVGLIPPSRNALAAGLVAVLVVDLWLFGFKMVRLESMAPAPVWVEAADIIGETEQRVLPWGISAFDQNGAGQVGLSSVFGYNPLEIATHQRFAASVADPRSTAYDILGVEYVIAGGPMDESMQGERPLELVGNSDSAWVYRRARVMPIARLVYEVEVIADDASATARVHEPDFDPAATAIVNETPPCEIGPAPEMLGAATVAEERPGYWRIETESDEPALLVLAETAYPGWRVTVDAEPASVMTAYTTIRAVCLSAGVHDVEWQYDPLAPKAGAAITLIGLMLLGITGVAKAISRHKE